MNFVPSVSLACHKILLNQTTSLRRCITSCVPSSWTLPAVLLFPTAQETRWQRGDMIKMGHKPESHGGGVKGVIACCSVQENAKWTFKHSVRIKPTCIVGLTCLGWADVRKKLMDFNGSIQTYVGYVQRMDSASFFTFLLNLVVLTQLCSSPSGYIALSCNEWWRVTCMLYVGVLPLLCSSVLHKFCRSLEEYD